MGVADDDGERGCLDCRVVADEVDTVMSAVDDVEHALGNTGLMQGISVCSFDI